jgi:hypothetical protein
VARFRWTFANAEFASDEERHGSNELAERLSESAERVLSGRIQQIRIQGDCPAGKPRGRDAGGMPAGSRTQKPRI